MRSSRTDSGLTLVEMAVAVAVFTMGMVMMLGSFERASDFSGQAGALAGADSSARRSTSKLVDLFSEASAENVDTLSRFHNVGATINFATDRFWTNSLRQCWNANCGFHTRGDLSVNRKHHACSFEYRNGLGTVSSTMGKIWSVDTTNCAFDGNALMNGAYLDGVRLFVARADGTFQMNQGRPLWRTMVFVFPRENSKGLMDLVRCELRIEDLIAAAPVTTGAWTRWANADLDWIDILDFGSDGTNDALPDGSVPLTPQNSDGDGELFSSMTTNNGPGVVYNKHVGMAGAAYRFATISVDLATGTFNFNIEHHEDATTSWSVVGQVTRAPEVLVNDVTEFAVSTATSNPYDAVTNPTGVEQDGVVRVHIGTSRKYRRDGQELWEHHVDTFTVRPRN